MPSTTATRTRRVRCAGCTELFTRDQLTEGQCATCASIVDAPTIQTLLTGAETICEGCSNPEGEISYVEALGGGFCERCAAPDADAQLSDLEANATANWVLVATTEAAPALVERRCAGCAEWFPADQLADFRCGGCAAESAPDASEAIVLADEQVPQQDDTAVMTVSPIETFISADGHVAPIVILTSPLPGTDTGFMTPESEAQPAAPAQVSKLWTVTRRSAGQLVDWVGPRESFDEAQRRASQLAKASKRETGVRPHWLSVHEWLLGNGEQLLLVRVES